MTDGYLFETPDPAEWTRLDAQTALWDPFTFRQLEQTGISRGWCCQEIGAGTGSVAAWLVERVGPTGRVVATDIETRWLSPSANLEIRHHNVVDDPVDRSGYDLIHARLVLEHLPQRHNVLAKLVDALRPGGWLVVEDYDLRTISVTEPAHASWSAVARGVVAVLRGAGVDPHFGAALHAALRGVGLADVAAEGVVHCHSTIQLGRAFLPVLDQLGERIVATGIARADQVDDVVAQMRHGDAGLVGYTPMLVAARGRRLSSRQCRSVNAAECSSAPQC